MIAVSLRSTITLIKLPILIPHVYFSTSPKKNTKSEKEHQSPDPAPLLKQAFDIAVQEDGWAFLGTLGHHLRQLDPSFDARTYGHSQLSTLVRAYSKLFEIKEVKSPEGNSVIYVRWKE